MRIRSVRHAGRCIGLVVAISAPATAFAQDIQTSMVASVGGSAESNPYNAATTDGVAVAATAELRPTITVRDEVTTIDVTGLAQFRQFLRRYGLEDNYGLNANIVRRQSALVTLRGTSAFSFSRGGFNGFGRPSLSSGNGVATPPQASLPQPEGGLPNTLGLLTDVNLLGQRSRVVAFSSGVGADATLDAYSSVSVDLSARAMRFQLTSYDDYNSYSTEVRFNRTLDELLSVGLIGSFGRTNYLDLGQGDAGTANVLASIDRRLGSRWSLSLAVGASFTNIEGRGGNPDVHFTALSTRVRFCWQGEYSNLCLGGERSPQPAAQGSVRVSSTFTADYSLRLSERERFTLTGSYARTGRGRDLSVGAAPAIDFASASARYDNQLDKRLTAFITANTAKIFTPGLRRPANVGVAIGLQVRIGAGQ